MEDQRFLLIIKKPTLIYDNNILNRINEYKNKYQQSECYFYYQNIRIYLSKLGYDFFNLRENWKSVNLDYVVLYYLNYTPRECAYQFFYPTQNYPTLNIFYLPFNFWTRQIVFTSNCGFTRTANGSQEKIFSIGKKILSTVNESIKPEPYSAPEPAVLSLSPSNAATKYGPKFNNDNNTLLTIPANNICYIREPQKFDQIIIYPNFQNAYSVQCGSVYSCPQYDRQRTLLEVPKKRLYAITELPRYVNMTDAANQNADFEEPLIYSFLNIDNNNLPFDAAIQNIYVGTSPIIGNNTLTALYLDKQPTDQFQSSQIISKINLTTGNVTLVAGLPVINFNDNNFKFYLYERPYKYQTNKNYSTYRYFFYGSTEYTSTKPLKVISQQPNGTWTETSITSIYMDVTDVNYLIYNNKDFQLGITDIPPSGYTSNLIINSYNSSNHSVMSTPSYKNTVLNYQGTQGNINNGAIYVSNDNASNLKVVNFDKLTISQTTSTTPIVRDTFYISGAIGESQAYNEIYSSFWASKQFVTLPSSDLSLALCDDKPFSIGLRQIVNYFNTKEYNSYFFISTFNLIFNLEYTGTEWSFDINTNLYKYKSSFSLQTKYGRFTNYTMTVLPIINVNSTQTSNFNLVVGSDLGRRYQENIIPSYIINGKNAQSFANVINNQTSFSIYANSNPLTNITVQIHLN